MPKMYMQDRGDKTATLKALFPAVDASMITQMKRRAAVVADLVSHPVGRKGTGAFVDGPHTRGFTDSTVRMAYINKGAAFSFFRVV